MAFGLVFLHGAAADERRAEIFRLRVFDGVRHGDGLVRAVEDKVLNPDIQYVDGALAQWMEKEIALKTSACEILVIPLEQCTAGMLPTQFVDNALPAIFRHPLPFFWMVEQVDDLVGHVNRIVGLGI